MSQEPLSRRELVRLMPRTGKDHDDAIRIVQLGYPRVEPVLPDMVRWLRVPDAPVSDVFADFLAQLGDPAADVVAWRGLHPENVWARHRILCDVLPRWPLSALRRVAFMLTTTATQPDAYDNDLVAVELLAKHGLAELDWLADWVTFKDEMHAKRTARLRHARQAVDQARGS